MKFYLGFWARKRGPLDRRFCGKAWIATGCGSPHNLFHCPQGSRYYNAEIFFLMETWNDGPDSFMKLKYVHRWKKRGVGTRNRGWAQPFGNVLMRP